MAKIIRKSLAGTFESSDALIMIAPADELTIEIHSTVKERFGEEIENAVREQLSECGVDAAYVKVQDRGAVDCVLKSRTEAAVKRAME